MRGSDSLPDHFKRSKSTYTNSLKGQFTTQYRESNGQNKNMHDWILSNKFDYGYNPAGGRHNASALQGQEKKVEANEIHKIVNNQP